MSDETVDDCQAALKFIPDWFVTSKMLQKSGKPMHANNDMVFYNEDSDKVTFITNQRHILAVDLDKSDLDDNNFDEDDPDTIIDVKLLAWQSKFKHVKPFKNK